MINWNFQRKQMRENMRKASNNNETSESRDNKGELTYFGQVYSYKGTLVKVSYKTSANTAVVTFLEGEDKGKVGTINLTDSKLVKENKV